MNASRLRIFLALCSLTYASYFVDMFVVLCPFTPFGWWGGGCFRLVRAAAAVRLLGGGGAAARLLRAGRCCWLLLLRAAPTPPAERGDCRVSRRSETQLLCLVWGVKNFAIFFLAF